MKYHTVTGENAVMLKPETIEEVGLCQWLARRFGGKPVRLEFDTTILSGAPHEPMLWLKPEQDGEGRKS